MCRYVAAVDTVDMHLGGLHARHVGLGDLRAALDGRDRAHVHGEVLVHDGLGVGDAAVRHDRGLQVNTVTYKHFLSNYSVFCVSELPLAPAHHW